MVWHRLLQFLIKGNTKISGIFICCDLIASALTLVGMFCKMEASLKTWEEFIVITGGCLVPNKSLWYLVNYTWKNRKWHCSDPQDVIYELKATKLQGGCQQLTRLT